MLNLVVMALHMHVVEKLVKTALGDGKIKFLNPVIYFRLLFGLEIGVQLKL